MRLVDVLDESRVSVGLEPTDKNAVFDALARLFAGPDVPEAEARRALLAREKLQTTGVGDGVAIPHGRTPAVSQIVCAFMVFATDVPFDAVDGEPVRIVAAILAPEKHTGDHLKALARLSRLLRDPSVRAELMMATDSKSLYRYIVDQDAIH